eukprot:TRINITY_DN1717_c2_g1_i2.p1 TRINITY_DN1717_c2_g1~~TRINITY_DN1717_c2_g1_i2.p1  ORF type:complete len:102 (+),score=0.86 TRINITY_DN1717_c2_g1_i2:296-601(+)
MMNRNACYCKYRRKKKEYSGSVAKYLFLIKYTAEWAKHKNEAIAFKVILSFTASFPSKTVMCTSDVAIKEITCLYPHFFFFFFFFSRGPNKKGGRKWGSIF